MGDAWDLGDEKTPTYGSVAVTPSRRVLISSHFRRQTPEKIQQSLKAIRLKIKELTAIDQSMVGLGLSHKNIKALIAEQRVIESIAKSVLVERSGGMISNPTRKAKSHFALNRASGSSDSRPRGRP
jgi:hypothetical protein